MPVYNSKKYLEPAIQSVLSQSFKDFELIIIDDGSLDKSARIIKSFSDPRIRFIQNKKNQGIVACLNRGLRIARGQYIARMDADDLSLKNRFEKQVQFLDNNPASAVVGSWIKPINDYDRKKFHFFSEPDILKSQLLFIPSISHPTAMIRKNALIKAGGYRDKYPLAEDFDLWIRLSKNHQLANLQQVLLKYRIHFDRFAGQSKIVQQRSVRRLIIGQLKELNLNPGQRQIKLHLDLIKGKNQLDPQFLKKVKAWFGKIKRANQNKGIYDQSALEEVLNSYEKKAKSLAVSPWHWAKGKLKELYKIIGRNLGCKIK
ncbi:MAG: glycosyltransferase [Patescibacteria group bacterium]